MYHSVSDMWRCLTPVPYDKAIPLGYVTLKECLAFCYKWVDKCGGVMYSNDGHCCWYHREDVMQEYYYVNPYATTYLTINTGKLTKAGRLIACH